jgi:hypothetical protein
LSIELCKTSARNRSGSRPHPPGILHWQIDPDLAGIRDPAAVANLPADEQEACKKL